MSNRKNPSFINFHSLIQNQIGSTIYDEFSNQVFVKIKKQTEIQVFEQVKLLINYRLVSHVSKSLNSHRPIQFSFMYELKDRILVRQIRNQLSEQLYNHFPNRFDGHIFSQIYLQIAGALEDKICNQMMDENNVNRN